MRHVFADCVLDEDRHQLSRGGAVVPVEPQVFDLLVLLVRSAGRLVSRDEIVDAVWGGRIVSESAISARIAAARRAVGDDGQRQAVIRTVARRGLQMVAEVTGDGPARVETGDVTPPRIRYTRNAEGHMLAWTATGAGTPVLRIGGPLVGLAEQMSFPLERILIDAVAKHHQLVHFDTAGFGLSAAIAEPFDLVRMTGDCIAVADAAGFDRFTFFSESGASLVAVRLAALFPERVSKLVLVGGYVDGRARRGPAPDPIRGLIKEGWNASGSGLALAYLLSYFPEGPLEALQAQARLEQSASTEAKILRLRDAVNHDSVAELLPRVQCPTLIVQGRDNAVHPLSEAQKLAAGIPGAELVVLDTANHVPLPGNAVWPDYLDTLLGFLGS